MSKIFKPEIPYSHQPYLFLHEGTLTLVFVAAWEKIKHPFLDMWITPWQVYVSTLDSNTLNPIPLPYTVCCNPIISGQKLSVIGGISAPAGLDYRLYEYNLTSFLYPLDCREIAVTFTGFSLPFICYQISPTRLLVVGETYNLDRHFGQILRVAPLAESNHRILVTGVGAITGDLRTGLFDIRGMNLIGWVLNEEGEHIYKSSLYGNLLAYAAPRGGADFEDRKIMLSSYRLAS